MAVLAAVVAAFAMPALAHAATPPNDDIATAAVLSGASGTVFGTRAEATSEPAEVPSMPHYHSIWYAWTAPSFGVLTFDTAGTAWAWSFAGQVDTGHMKINGQRSGFFNVAQGVTYLIGLDDWTDGGPTQLGWTFTETPPPPANDDWTSPQVLDAAAATVSLDTSGASRQGCDGDLGYGYSVWYSWTAPESGELTIQAKTDVRGTIAGVYTYDGSTPCPVQVGRSGGDPAVVNVNAGIRYLLGVDTWGDTGGPTSFSYAFATVTRPTNDDFANALPFGSEHRGSVSGDATHATSEPGEPTPLGSKTVWYTWTPDVDGVASVDFDLGAGIVFTGDSLGSLVWLASGGARFDVTAGMTYRIQVAASGDYGVGWLLEPNTPPANDLFAAAQPLGKTDGGYVESTNRLATVETGEPDHGGFSSASVWFTWVAPADGNMVFWVDSGAWSVVQAYVGSELTGLAPVQGERQEWDAQRVSFAAKSGTTYRIAVDSRAGGTGIFWLGWLTEAGGPGSGGTPPDAQPDSFETMQDTQLVLSSADLLANDSDPDGDAIALGLVGHAVGGTVDRLDDDTVVFTPDAGFVGTTRFQYTLVDATGLDATGTVTVHVVAVHHAPTVSLTAAASSIKEGGTTTLTAIGEDADGDALDYTWSTSLGTLDADGPNAALFVDDGPATATVTVTVSDGSESAVATQDIAVENVAPTFSVKTPVGPWGVPLPLVLHATDPSKADTAAGLAPTWVFPDVTLKGESVMYAFPSPAANRATVSVADKDGSRFSRAFVAKIFSRGSSLTYTAPATAPFGFAAVGAKLSDTFDPATAKLAGRAIAFSVGGASLSATTSADGSGSAGTGPVLPGTYAVDAQFAGDPLYARSGASGSLTIVNSAGKVNGDVVLADGTHVVFAATGDGSLVRGSLAAGSLAGSVTALGISGSVSWFAGTTADGHAFVVSATDAAEPGKGADEVRLWVDGVMQPGGGVIADGNVQLHK